ncbi:MAG: 4-(cytidine 5'-diphospho)-2-C-methyl-D-erythritol kinase [Candidatus Omnitrophica bacterium]|nr:4-(cytidine 5'-diphospho)-2-C-methyl-D-erythritol kinase [Candidatus Omnitrophota bacterium]
MLRLHAPAKLNLFLHVVGKRPDGYHELETLFERIDLADELTFAPAARLQLTCSDPSLDTGPSNLVTKAAVLLQEATGISTGATIHLTKRIPIAAGLGGGSSDAATALLGLNRLWAAGLSRQTLRELGAQVGSDVPFFLEEAAFGIGRGRGERCEALAEPWPSLWHVLVSLDARLSTQEVYEGLDGTALTPPRGAGLTPPRPSLNILVHALRNGSLRELAEGMSNDLQPEAIRRCPVIEKIQQHLRATGCLGTMVSGSGPSVFGFCEDRAQAQRVAQQLRRNADPSWRIAVVKTFKNDQ